MAYFCLRKLTIIDIKIDMNCRNYKSLVARSVGERNVVEKSCLGCWLNYSHVAQGYWFARNIVDIVFYLIITLQVASGAPQYRVIYLPSFPLPLAEDKPKISRRYPEDRYKKSGHKSPLFAMTIYYIITLLHKFVSRSYFSAFNLLWWHSISAPSSRRRCMPPPSQ